MLRYLAGAVALLLPFSPVVAQQVAAQDAAPSDTAPSDTGAWVQLFDGRKMAGLVIEPGSQSKFVTIQDGVIRIVGSMDGGWLHTDRKYADFTIAFDIRFVENETRYGGGPHGNNGLILRSPEISTSGRNWPGRGFEMELWDQSKRGGFSKNGTLLGLQPGAPSAKYSYDIGAAQRADRPTGEWMHVEVIAHGDRVWTKLNGEWLSTNFDVAHPDGHVGFQIEDGITELRDIRIREHTAQTVTPETIVPLFKDGQLHGLAPADSRYAGNVAIDGGMLRLSGPGGWLKTAQKYTSYVLRLQFRTLTADASGGVYLRQDGDAADASGWPLNTDMVRILSQRVPPPTGAAGDPRWFGAFLSRGTAGGKATIDTGEVLRAWRGVGEWQEAVFDVDGSRVTISLNGIEIAQGDGVANLARGGHVGLEIGQGAMEFRQIEISGYSVD